MEDNLNNLGCKHIRVGTRRSELAMIQTKIVVNELKSIYPLHTFEIIGIDTTGDKIQNVALSKIGEKSLFTKELESGLLDGSLDLVVHSLKDLPTSLPSPLTIAAITKREESGDAVLLSKKRSSFVFNNLPKGSVVGTSSLRRIAQLRRSFPNYDFRDIRGNLNTRLRKLDSEEFGYDAIILATAGVNRMGWSHRISYKLENEECMYAVGQGALGIECNSERIDITELLRPLNDPEAYFRCLAERSFLRTLEGGCSVPIAVVSYYVKTINSVTLYLKGGVFSLDGTKEISNELSANLTSSLEENIIFETHLTSVTSREFNNYDKRGSEIAAALGFKLGQNLLTQGAQEILDEVRREKNKSTSSNS